MQPGNNSEDDENRAGGLICNDCFPFKNFSNPANLKVHKVDTHDQVWEFDIPGLGSFNLYENINKRIVERLSNGKFNCPINGCNSMFAQLKTIKNHLKFNCKSLKAKAFQEFGKLGNQTESHHHSADNDSIEVLGPLCIFKPLGLLYCCCCNVGIKNEIGTTKKPGLSHIKDNHSKFIKQYNPTSILLTLRQFSSKNIYALDETPYYTTNVDRSLVLETIPVLKVEDGICCKICNSFIVSDCQSGAGKRKMLIHLNDKHDANYEPDHIEKTFIQALTNEKLADKYFKVDYTPTLAPSLEDQLVFQQQFENINFVDIISPLREMPNEQEDYYVKRLGIKSFISSFGGIEILKSLIDNQELMNHSFPSLDRYFETAKWAINTMPLALKKLTRGGAEYSKDLSFPTDEATLTRYKNCIVLFCFYCFRLQDTDQKSPKSNIIQLGFKEAFSQNETNWLGILTMMKELVLFHLSLNNCDHSNPFISFLLTTAAVGSQEETLRLDLLTRHISPIKFFIRSFVAIAIMKNPKDTKRTVEEGNESLFKKYIQFVQDQPTLNQSPYSSLITFSGLISSLAKNIDSSSRETINLINIECLRVRIDNAEFDKAMIIDFFENATRHAESSMEKLLLGFNPLQHIDDCIKKCGSVTNERVGNCFWDYFPEYNSQHQPVFGKWLKENKPNFFAMHPRKEQWIVDCDELLNLLLVLIHTTCGGPPRATELLSILIQNQEYSKGNITIRHGMLCILIQYNKTQELSQKQVSIDRYLPPRVGNLVAAYLLVLRPWMIILNDSIFLKTKLTNMLATRYYTIFSHVFSEHGSGFNMGVMNWRHWAKFVFKILKFDFEWFDEGWISKIFVYAKSLLDDSDLNIDAQFGHSYKTGKIYGTSAADLYLATGSQGLAQSKAWHQFFSLGSDNREERYKTDNRQERYIKDISIKSDRTNTHHQISRYQNNTNQIPTNSIELEQHSSQKYDPSRSMQLLSKLKVIHGANATWKSAEQGIAAYHVADGMKDTVIVLPTGGGKSETILCACLLPTEMNKTTVVLVPTTALKLNMIERFNSNGILTGDSRSEKIVVVTFQKSCSQEFRQWLSSNCQTISRIVFDEAHTILAWQSFALSFRDLRFLRQEYCPVPLVFLSATMSSEMRVMLMNEFGLDSKNLNIVIANPERPNLKFSRIITDDLLSDVLLDTALSGKRVIIICMSKKEPYTYGQDNGFSVYPNGPDETDELKSQVLSQWHIASEHDPKRVLIGTSALLLGLDYPDVDLVIFFKAFYSYLDFFQGGGRSGRNLLSRGRVVLLSTKQICYSEKISKSIDYGLVDGCLRVNVMKEFSNNPLPCHLIPNVNCCDVCSTVIDDYVQIATPPVISYFEKDGNYTNDIVVQLDRLLNGPSYWASNCLLCFLIQSSPSYIESTNDPTDYHIGHRERDCISDISSSYCNCNICFDDISHAGSSFCANFLGYQSPGLCFQCLWPQKIGPNYWLHTQENFGPSKCVQKSVGRLLWIFRATLATYFNHDLSLLDSRKEFINWLSELVGGIPRVVLAYIHLAGNADQILSSLKEQ